MDHYEHALTAMELLLDQVGEFHWRDWIRLDLAEWTAARSVQHHLSAYGGMGSLNDLIICSQNCHTVTPAQEPWANCLFNDLKSVCYHLARHVDSGSPTDGLELAMGTLHKQLRGWRCLSCGYSEVTHLDLEWFIAGHRVRRGILEAIPASQLDAFVRAMLALNAPELDGERADLAKAASLSGIQITAREGWLRPCPACGGRDTAVYRWIRRNGEGPFTPADENLPLR